MNNELLGKWFLLDKQVGYIEKIEDNNAIFCVGYNVIIQKDTIYKIVKENYIIKKELKISDILNLKGRNITLKELHTGIKLTPVLIYNDSKLYFNFESLFKDNSIQISTGKIFILNKYLMNYSGTISIEQYNNSYLLYIKLKGKEAKEIFKESDLFDFIRDLQNYYNTDISRVEYIFNLINQKEELLIKSFIINESNYKIVRDALAYRYVGLVVSNKINREESVLLKKLFEEELNYSISMDDKGNIKYNLKK